MCGIDDQHRVKLESDRTRLNVAHAGQQQGREQIAVAQAAFDSGGGFLQQTFARGVLQKTHERFNVRIESNDVRFQSGFRGGNRPQSRQKSEIAQAKQRAGANGRLHKTSACARCIHFPTDELMS